MRNDDGLGQGFDAGIFEPFSAKAPFSTELHGIDWAKHFPTTIPSSSADQVRTIALTDFETASRFILQNGDVIFQRNESENPFLREKMSEAKKRYYRTFGDFFSFLCNGKTVGVFIGTPADWSTYYLRSCAILPQHQGKGYFRTFLTHLLRLLQEAGVQRVEGDVAAANWVEFHLFNQLGFRPTGFMVSERWGALMRLSNFLDAGCERIFLNQFCDGPRLTRRKEEL